MRYDDYSKEDRKRLAYISIKNAIEEIINQNKKSSLIDMRDLERFIAETPDLRAFQERSKYNNTVRRAWNFQLTEEDYQQLLIEMKAELEEKLRIEKEKLSTVNVNGKEITTYKEDENDKNPIVVDNTYASKPIEAQLPELQEKYAMFREEGSTKDMMEFMAEEIKPEPAFTSVAEVNPNSLSGQDREIANVAEAYQEKADSTVQVDLENRLIMDEGQILSIEEREDGYGVYSPEVKEDEEVAEMPGVQKKLTKPPMQQAGFSSAVTLALLSGLLMGLAFLNLFK